MSQSHRFRPSRCSSQGAVDLRDGEVLEFPWLVSCRLGEAVAPMSLCGRAANRLIRLHRCFFVPTKGLGHGLVRDAEACGNPAIAQPELPKVIRCLSDTLIKGGFSRLEYG